MKILGMLMIIVFFAGLISWTAKIMGWRDALVVWVGAVISAAFIITGVLLATGQWG